MDNTDCLYDNRLNSKIKIFKFIPLEILRENINTYTDWNINIDLLKFKLIKIRNL